MLFLDGKHLWSRSANQYLKTIIYAKYFAHQDEQGTSRTRAQKLVKKLEALEHDVDGVLPATGLLGYAYILHIIIKCEAMTLLMICWAWVLCNTPFGSLFYLNRYIHI